MIRLQFINFLDVQHWFYDFQKKSKCFEMPSDHADYIGIFDDNKLIGYFITSGYNNKTVIIEQGYLKPEVRHKDLSKQCVKLLEEAIKKTQYKEIKLCTQNRFKSYIDFMKSMGYKPEKLIFSKVVN